jgi:Carboxypeptidase regulatory-like domain
MRCPRAALLVMSLPLFWLASLLVLWAQLGAPAVPGAQSSQQSAVSGTSALEGTVVNAQTGEPVRKAEITAIWSGGRNTDNGGHDPQTGYSDGNGHFSINGLPAGKYRLRVEANRFAAQSYGESRFGGRGKDVEVAAGQRVSDLHIRLVPCGVITGEVHDESGDPVEGAMVQAISVGRMRGFQGGNQAQTNDLGQYRLYSLAPGQYVIQVSMSRPENPQQGTQETYVPLFYPDATDPASASTLNVDPGSETQGIDIDVRPVHAVRVLGRVVSEPSARSTQNAYVILMPVTTDPRKRMGAISMYAASRYATNVTGPGGDFEISGVPAGSYWATASVQDDRRQDQGRVLVQVGDTDVQGLIVPVGPGVNLTGRVRVDPQRAFDFSKLAVAAIPSEPGTMGGQGTQVRPDGSFVLENLSIGNYRVNVSGYPEEYYVKSVSMGGGDLLETGLSIDSGAQPGQLDVVLTAGGSTVSGTVLRDQKPASATVFLVPDPPRRDRQDLYSMKRTQSDGSFTLLGIPPGDFKLFAFEDPDPGLINDPSMLQPYEVKGLSVHLEEGQKQIVQLDLIPVPE